MTVNKIEQAALDILSKDLGYSVIYGPDLTEGESRERDYGDVVLKQRLQSAIECINPDIPANAVEETLRAILRSTTTSLFENNQIFHQMLTEGIDVKFEIDNGRTKTDKIWLVDFEKPENNDFLAVNQFTVIENHQSKRPDIVLFVNGLPLVVIELTSIVDGNANVRTAFNNLQNYKQSISSLFTYNAFLIISDGWFAKSGTLSSDYYQFREWKTDESVNLLDMQTQSEMQPMIIGLLNKETLLDVIRHFIVFYKNKETTIKGIATYYQYYGVNRAIKKTIDAITSNDKDVKGRIGIVWHTQGSGKSLSMVFYSGKLVQIEQMNNPTIVVLTDRRDIEQQLFDIFENCEQLIRQKPKQVKNREDLKDKLSVASGGVIFTTIQKFLPKNHETSYQELSGRRNIIVIATDAHLYQYDSNNGYAKYMRDALPNASLIGFTGIPIERKDRNTKDVFGDYIHIYGMQRAVEDGAAVTLHYENRLAKIQLSQADQDILSQKVEEITEEDELIERQKDFSRWKSKEVIVGSEQRLKQVAKDLVSHFENRVSVTEGKAIIICMSRRICIALYNEIIKIRPYWHDTSDDKGVIKVVMTGSVNDPLDWQDHIRNVSRRNLLGQRLKDPTDPLKLVIVRDMWLTGFDAPSLHTLYIDRQMSGHNLMQAIGRISRVFGNKKEGLIVDYIGIFQELQKALEVFTKAKEPEQIIVSHSETVAEMLDFYGIVVGIFDGFDYKEYFQLNVNNKLDFILDAVNYVLGLKDEEDSTGKQRFIYHVTKLSQAFDLVDVSNEANKIRNDLAFFQAVKARIVKFEEIDQKSDDEKIKKSVRHQINDVIISKDIVDVFDAAGLAKPTVEILSDEFLEQISNLPRKNLALELLKRLLSEEIKIRSTRNLAQSSKFSKMLAEAIKHYQDEYLEVSQIIEELILLAQEIRDDDKRGKQLNLQQDELAFYDALADNHKVESVLDNETLKIIAHEVVDSVRHSTLVDWQLKESVQARLRVVIKRILRKYEYPPDDITKNDYNISVSKLLNQAELLADFWTKEL